MPQLVLIRHGQSQWNLENRFTGWVDQDLSANGEVEAAAAGELLRQEGFTFDMAFTSRLKRAIRTLWFIQHRMDLCWIPTTKAWQLNERHYGALQGLNKSETAAEHGSAVPVVPVKDSLRQVQSERDSVAVDRSVMRAVQTPQCFDLALLKEAFNTLYQDQFTDDASVVEAAGHVVTLCEGDPWNVKVTTPEDLVIAEAFVEASWGQDSEGASAAV